MDYQLISKKTSKLTKKEILKICTLKNTHWKYGIKSQLNWFKSNFNNSDINNLLYIDKKLIGYTALKKRVFYFCQKKENYLLFDTLIIDKKFRGKKISSLLMYFNNEIIIQNRKIAFLMCKSNQVNYYAKYMWKKLHDRRFVVYDHTFKKKGMVFNLRKLKYKFFTFLTNK